MSFLSQGAKPPEKSPSAGGGQEKEGVQMRGNGLQLCSVRRWHKGKGHKAQGHCSLPTFHQQRRALPSPAHHSTQCQHEGRSAPVLPHPHQSQSPPIPIPCPSCLSLSSSPSNFTAWETCLVSAGRSGTEGVWEKRGWW